jgi:hypothetical protein
MLDQITPDWLTMILRRHGCISKSAVNAIAVQGIGAEVGFLDVLARLRLTYDQAEGGAPVSVVVKLPAPDGIYRRIGNFYHAYEREIRFYAEVAPHSPLCLPRCFYREMDRETDSYFLILEDLESLATGDQVKGLTPAQAQACVETIGRFHAFWWDTPKLGALDWMPHRNIQPSRYHSAWPTFRQTVGPLLPASAVALGHVGGGRPLHRPGAGRLADLDSDPAGASRRGRPAHGDEALNTSGVAPPPVSWSCAGRMRAGVRRDVQGSPAATLALS